MPTLIKHLYFHGIKYCRLIKQLIADKSAQLGWGGCKHKVFVQISEVIGKELLRDSLTKLTTSTRRIFYKIYKYTFFCPN